MWNRDSSGRFYIYQGIIELNKDIDIFVVGEKQRHKRFDYNAWVKSGKLDPKNYKVFLQGSQMKMRFTSISPYFEGLSFIIRFFFKVKSPRSYDINSTTVGASMDFLEDVLVNVHTSRGF